MMHIPIQDKFELVERNVSGSKAKSQVIYFKQILSEAARNLQKLSDESLRVKEVFKVLKRYCEAQTYWGCDLWQLIQELERAVFFRKAAMQPTMKNWIYEKYDSLAADTTDKVPFSCIVEFYQAHQQQQKLEKKQLKLANSALQSSLQANIHKIKTLTDELNNAIAQNDSKIALQELEKAKKLLIFNKALYQKKFTELTKSINDLNEELLTKEQTIKARELSISIKIKEYNDLLEENAINLMRTQDVVNENKKLSSFTYVCLDKIKLLNREKLNLEEKIRLADNKNLVLSVRAAEGFENLTPRPSFEQIQGLLLEHKVGSSTQARTAWLVRSLIGDANKKRRTLISRTTRKQDVV